MEKATFGSGCFWCTEAMFQRLKGVSNVKSGYSGGHTKNPTYKEVCSGASGHAEVIQLEYDPEIITYDELLEVFWKTHDPTTLNRQGNDVGTQYRSVIFYHSESQKELALSYKKKLEASNIWPDPIVTEISPYEEFYPAEIEHDNYYNENASQPYCAFIVAPKVEKFKKIFAEKLN
ncbi:peptide-methionine (S)-S-oxide reductase MsrA [Ekhidna sp.]|uniref:peptide-methionine (S)-S-oxide reductase MsrA n=1 Tax=Ekhidna sp. TaxID=2608089 RepID=UPI003CCBA318